MNAGKYVARAISADLGVTKTGKLEHHLEFEVLEGEHKGERVSAFLYYSSPESQKRSIQSLRFCGFTSDNPQDLAKVTFPEDNRVRIEVEMNEYQGRTSPRVKWINAYSGMKKPEPTPEQLSVFFIEIAPVMRDEPDFDKMPF